LVGPLEVGETTQAALIRHANNIGEIDLDSEDARKEHADQIGRILQLIVASREFQFA